MMTVLRFRKPALPWVAILWACNIGASAQSPEVWSLDVRVLTSVPFGRPGIGEGTGWGGQPLLVQEGPLTAGWGRQGTRSHGVSIRRGIGRSWQLAFGFEQTRRIWSAQADWLNGAGPAPETVTVNLEWIQASYAFPLMMRSEVQLVPGWRLGAGGGLVWEILPTNAFEAGQQEGTSGTFFSVEHETLRYGWNRWGMGMELGVVREGKDMDVHVGGVVRPSVQPFSQGQLTAQWNIGQPDVSILEVGRSLDGGWWGLDVRVILH